jgi:hypothetical protein
VQGDAGEGQEVICFALVAAMQSSASCEPGHGPFNGPVPSKALVRIDTTASDAGRDTPAAQPSVQVLVVISLVAVELVGSASAPPAAGTDRWDALHERDQGLAVVRVRC